MGAFDKEIKRKSAVHKAKRKKNVKAAVKIFPPFYCGKKLRELRGTNKIERTNKNEQTR